MAIEVAQAYVTILPSMKGIQQKMGSELTKAAKSAGKEAGKSIEDGLEGGASKGASEAGKSVVKTLDEAGKKAGESSGKGAGDGMRKGFSKAVDDVSKDVRTKLSGAFSKVGDSLQGVGSMAKSSFGEFGAAFREMTGSFGSAFKGSAVGGMFTSMASGAKTAAANIAGTFKGVGQAVGGVFGSMRDSAGKAFSHIDRSTGGLLSKLGTAARGAVSSIGSAFASLPSKVGDAFSKVGSGLLGVLKKLAKPAAAGLAGVTASLGVIGKSALDAYGDFEQLEGGIRLALGDDVWKTVEGRSKDAFANVQMSQNDYLASVNYMATGLREALGGDQKAAAELADRVITTQADVVSAMGVSQEAAQNAFQGIMKGNFTMLDNLGLGIKPTKEGFQEIIDKMNEWNATQSDRTATQYNIDNLADCQSALADYVEYLGLAGYAANEGSQTIQGSISKMKGAWTDWMAELAKPDADMGRVTENLMQSFTDVASNVVPAVARAIGAALPQLPGVVMQIAPVLGNALLDVVDSATGGLGTKVLEFVSPVTEALSGAFSGIGDWVQQNSGMLSQLGGQFAELGSTIMSGLGTAISTVAPIVGDLASAALPMLSSALSFVSGAAKGVSGLISGLADAFSPLGEVVGPIASAIGGALTDALSSLGDVMGSADFSGFAEGLKSAVQGVVDFVQGALDAVTGFIDSVASFINDPIGTIENGFSQLVLGSDGVNKAVSSNFSGVANGVANGTNSAIGSINKLNRTKVNNQSAVIKTTGNVVDGTAKAKADSTKKSVDSLTGKSISVGATGNVIDGSASRGIQDVADRIYRLSGKTVDVITRNITKKITEGGNARGAVIPRHADGFIAAEPVLTDVGWIGEAGAEAVYSNGRSTGIFPLTNRKFTGPFANEIAAQVLDGMGGGEVNVYLNYDAGADANQMARDLAREVRRYRMAGVM